LREHISERAEAEIQPATDLDLPIESVLCPNHLAECAECHATPGGDVEHGQRVVGAEEEALVKLRIVEEVQQHAHTIGLCRRGDIGVEMWVALSQVLKVGDNFS
jgi:hypothetical protein